MCCQFTVEFIKTKTIPAQDASFVTPCRLVLIMGGCEIFQFRVEIQVITVVSSWGYSLVLFFFCMCN